jgi:hypothetical protein
MITVSIRGSEEWIYPYRIAFDLGFPEFVRSCIEAVFLFKETKAPQQQSVQKRLGLQDQHA